MKKAILERIPEALRPAAHRAWHHGTLRGSRHVVAWRMRTRASRTDTLSGLLHRKMLHDRRPLLTSTADKLAARDFIAAQVGPGYLPTLLAAGPVVEGIDGASLPREYAAKVNHGSGGIVMVTDDAEVDEALPPKRLGMDWARYRVRPEVADWNRIADLSRHGLTLDYSWCSGHRSIQWCCEGIPRRVMVEELLRDEQGNPPREYRLFVIGGLVRFLQVEMREDGRDCTPVMTRDWELLPARFLNPLPGEAPEQPEALPEMLEVAECLARPFGDFLRVDLYDLGSRIVVGELTHYPYGGRLPVRPRSFDREWARYWPLVAPLREG